MRSSLGMQWKRRSPWQLTEIDGKGTGARCLASKAPGAMTVTCVASHPKSQTFFVLR
jgi:hypothetical protein